MESLNKNNNVIDLTRVLEGYSGKWVVLSRDNKQVLKSGSSIDNIIEFSDKGIIMLVPEDDFSYTP